MTVGSEAWSRGRPVATTGSSATVGPVLRYRLVLGPILIAALVGALALDQWMQGAPLPAWAAMVAPDPPIVPPGSIMFVGMAAIAFLAARELARILRDKGIAASTVVTCGAAMMGLVVSCLVPSALSSATAVAIVSSAASLVLLVALTYYARNKSFQGVVAAAGGTLLAFVYLGLMFGFILATRREHSAWTVLWVLLVPKAYDTGAYFSGRAFGRHKLIPWLSPGKTWEGLAGGTIASAALGTLGLMLLRNQDNPNLPGPVAGAVACAIFGLVGQGGDLVASLFKRDAGIKDSGDVLPGFGGVLDVVDSPLLVAPVAYWWLAMFA